MYFITINKTVDVDECQPPKNRCHQHADCVNTEGSYMCRCKTGYLGDGFSCVCEFQIFVSMLRD